MSAELIAIIAAAVSLGGLMTAQVASARRAADARTDRLAAAIDARFTAADARFDAIDARFDAIDTRLHTVETELAYLRGLIQGAASSRAIPTRAPRDGSAYPYRAR